MEKISVIMASYLGEYVNRASNPEKKFIRAVKSFLTQTYKNKELIIVADGCGVTESLYEDNFKEYDNVRLIKIPKQVIYSGECRNVGLEIAEGGIISYLDNDDVIGKKHLETIMSQFSDDVDLVYYDDYLVQSVDFKKLYKRYVEPRYGNIGTSAITHRKSDSLRWIDGYGHDYVFVSSAIISGMRFKKLEQSPAYLVCHYGNGVNGGDF